MHYVCERGKPRRDERWRAARTPLGSFGIDCGADMYSLTRNLTLRDAAVVEGPSFLLSLVVAQVFFRFGSFALELMGFLALWYVTSGAIKWLDGRKVRGLDEPAAK